METILVLIAAGLVWSSGFGVGVWAERFRTWVRVEKVFNDAGLRIWRVTNALNEYVAAGVVIQQNQIHDSIVNVSTEGHTFVVKVTDRSVVPF